MADSINVILTYQTARDRYLLRWNDSVSGKRRFKACEATSKKAREEERIRWQIELNANGYVDKLEWQDFLDIFERDHLAGLKVRSQESFRTALNKVTEVLDPQYIAAIDARALTRFVTQLRARKSKFTGKPLSATTIAQLLRHIKAALRWAENQGYIAKAPKVIMPKQPKNRMKGRPITLEEVERMIQAAPKVRPDDFQLWTDLLWGLWFSGLRLSEAVILSWDETEPIAVVHHGNGLKFRIEAEHQKSGRDELCPMAPDFEDWLFDREQRSGRVFGIDYSSWTVGKVVAAIATRANVKATAHDFRRAFGTRWAPRLQAADLQAIMRHGNIATTMSYYVDAKADDVADRMRASLKGQPTGQPGSASKKS